MALSAYVYENEKGKDAYIAGICNLLGDMYSLRLEKIGIDDGEVIAIDTFNANEQNFVDALKNRFLKINENEYIIGSSIEKERNDITNLKVNMKKVDEKFEDILFLLFYKKASVKQSVALKELSKELSEDIKLYLEDDFSNYQIYKVSGMQDNNYPHAFDYLGTLENAYLLINKDISILFLGGYEE